ncbi:MAG: DUF2631 domain-containing protein [Nakamurella sp.]
MAGTELERSSAAGRHQDDSHGAELAPVQHGEVVSYNPDAPSEEWGWHGSWQDMAPRGSAALLWLGVVGILLLIFGNHESYVEDYWLVVIAGLMAIWLIMRGRKHKQDRARRP